MQKQECKIEFACFLIRKEIKFIKENYNVA